MRRLLLRLNVSRKALVVGGAIALLLGGGTVAAYATVLSPVSGAGLIYGCYSNTAVKGSHTLVLVDAGTSCPKGTTAISWSQSGPAGPAGRPGQPGRAGKAGSSGAAAVVAAGAPAAACPHGGITVTGGNGKAQYVCNGAPGPTVTLTAPGPTVTAPGPTVTTTITAPGPTVTITAPGPTVTITAPQTGGTGGLGGTGGTGGTGGIGG
ncbi:MAG TPA: hypothetical protein VHF26_17800 [Trebonia sp.]|nr:hypothetical protein [Trebonia sp.]